MGTPNSFKVVLTLELRRQRQEGAQCIVDMLVRLARRFEDVVEL